MQEKIKKRIISILMILIVMTYLCISVNAVGTFGTKAYVIVTKNTTSTSAQSWQEITPNSTDFTVLNNTTLQSNIFNLYLSFKVNQVPQDGYVLVVTITLNSIVNRDSIQLIGAGQANSNTLPTNTSTPADLGSLLLNQEIIASTIEEIDDGNTRLTVTFKAKNFINTYPIAAWSFKKDGTVQTVSCANVELYETIGDAAGSGLTPEEMREVLSSWGEEELLPGIQDSVQAGVTSGMEAALEDEKQQANTDGNSAINELTGALNGVVDDIDQAKEAFNTLGSALQYSGTSASLTFPGMNVPFLGQISEPINFDITGYIDSTFPPQLLLLIRCALSIGIVSYPIFELVKQLRKLLDKG